MARNEEALCSVYLTRSHLPTPRMLHPPPLPARSPMDTSFSLWRKPLMSTLWLPLPFHWDLSKLILLFLFRLSSQSSVSITSVDVLKKRIETLRQLISSIEQANPEHPALNGVKAILEEVTNKSHYLGKILTTIQNIEKSRTVIGSSYVRSKEKFLLID